MDRISMSKSLKRFLMTLGATTVSIVLTFGTTAIVDRKKKKAEKREMVIALALLPAVLLAQESVTVKGGLLTIRATQSVIEFLVIYVHI